MNNNFYEIPKDWYNEFNNNFMNSVNNGMNFNNMPNDNNMPNFNNQFNMVGNMNDLTNPKEALDRGNLFNSLYEPYKNYKYRQLRASNNKEELLYNIMMHNFLLTELNLYLDVNPNETNIINLYKKYLNDKLSLVKEYENNFGPLTLDGDNIGTNEWNWNKQPWPWEGTK